MLFRSIPDDVQISVRTQAREDLIERTVQSLVGSDRATIHLYNATAPLFQRVVFGVTPDECRNIATRGTEMVMKYAEELLGNCAFGYQYSPEIFTQSNTDFALDVCEAVSDVRSEEHTSELQSLMRISYAVFCLKKKKYQNNDKRKR